MDNRAKVFIEVSSIVVALCAFFAATFLGYSEYLDKRAAVLPIISVKKSMDSTQTPKKFTIQLDNTGFGAARISYINLQSVKSIDYSRIEINGREENIFGTWQNDMQVLDNPIVLKPNASYSISVYFNANDMSLDEYFTNFEYNFDCKSIYRESCDVYGEQPSEIGL